MARKNNDKTPKKVVQSVLRLAASKTQRQIANQLDLSLGVVNKILATNGARSALSVGKAAAKRSAVGRPPQAVRKAVAKPTPQPTAPQPVAPSSRPRDEVPDSIPDDAPSEQLNRWLSQLWLVAVAAETASNLSAVLSITNKSQTILGQLVRAIPPAETEPEIDWPAVVARAQEKLEAITKAFLAGLPPPPPAPEPQPSAAAAPSPLLAEIGRWIELVDRAANKAKAEPDNYYVFAGLIARSAALDALRRRAAPPPSYDPSDDPEFKFMGDAGEERFVRLSIPDDDTESTHA